MKFFAFGSYIYPDLLCKWQTSTPSLQILFQIYFHMLWILWTCHSAKWTCRSSLIWKYYQHRCPHAKGHSGASASFSYLLQKKKNDCICWRLFFLPRIHCFLQWKVPYKRNWTSQRGVWSLRTFKLPSNPGCSMIHLVDTDKDTVSPCHLNLPPFPKPKQSKEKYSLFHH